MSSKMLALAGQGRIPVSGTLNTTAQVTGTIGDPHATADLTLTKGQIYGEPYDSVTGHAQYLNGGAQAADCRRRRREETSQCQRPLRAVPGKLTFNVTSNAMALDQIALARKHEPDSRGTAQVKADGVIQIDRKRVDVLDLNADLRATGLALGTRESRRRPLDGRDEERPDDRPVRFGRREVRDSRRRHGAAGGRLSGEREADFLQPRTERGRGGHACGPADTRDLNLDGSAAGEVTAERTGEDAGSDDRIASTSRSSNCIRWRSAATRGTFRIWRLRNNGPIRATLAKSVIRVDSARFQAPETDLALTGTIALNSQSPFDLRVQGNMNLALAQTYKRGFDVFRRIGGQRGGAGQLHQSRCFRPGRTPEGRLSLARISRTA